MIFWMREGLENINLKNKQFENPKNVGCLFFEQTNSKLRVWIISSTAISPTREPLLKGKTQYSWPPCINFLDKLLLKLQILFIFLQNNQPYEEVNCTKPSTSISIPRSSSSA